MVKKDSDPIQQSDESKANMNKQFKETGKIQFTLHRKPFMLENGKETETSDFNSVSCCLFLTFTLGQKLRHLLRCSQNLKNMIS